MTWIVDERKKSTKYGFILSAIVCVLLFATTM
jgi:hypothetical protein